MFKIISFGHRCSSAGVIKLLNLKTESYPFDWLISKLDVIMDCIDTKFVHFLNRNNYITQYSETFNFIDGKKSHICYETIHVNKYYQKDPTNIQTYKYKLALNHYNLHNDNDYQYYERCIKRLYDLLESDIKKYYLYFHYIMGINDYEREKKYIINKFEEFYEYISKKTVNITGIYFILISSKEPVKIIVLKENPQYIIYLLYCSEQFLDCGCPFGGDQGKELQEVLSTLQNIIPLQN
jgi:hypothetical protein